MDQHKLVGPNFLSWRRNLKIVLQMEQLDWTLERAPPEVPVPGSTRAVANAYERDMVPFKQAYCIMMGSMNEELQKQCENSNPRAIMKHLETLY